MFKKILSLIVITMICMPLYSCVETIKTDRTFRYDLQSEPENLDPQITDTPSSMTVLQNIMSGMFEIDSDGNIVNSCAETYTVSADGFDVTIKLKPGIVWSNHKGEYAADLTAADFEFAIKRIFSIPNNPLANDYKAIKNASLILGGIEPFDSLGIKAIDATTLKVELDSPSDIIPYLFAQPASYPCNEKFFNETKGKYGLERETLLYNGAFYLEKWEPDIRLTLRKNPLAISPEEISPATVYLYPPDPSRTALSRFENGTTDVVALSGIETEQINLNNYTVTVFEDTVWVIAFNQEIPAFANDSIRKAFSGAVTKMSHEKLPPYLSIADRIVPPALTIGKDSFRKKSDSSAATFVDNTPPNELIEAGLAELEWQTIPKITLTYPKYDWMPEIVMTLQQDLKNKLNVIINLNPVEIPEYQSFVQNNQYDFALIPVTVNKNDAGSFLQQFSNGYIGKGSTAFNSIMESAQAEQDIEKYIDFLVAAEQELLISSSVYPLYYQSVYFVSHNYIENLRLTPYGGKIVFKNALKSKSD